MAKKSEKVETNKITGTTESGFEYEIDADALDDYELIELLVEIDKGKNLLIVDAVKRLLGEEGKQKLLDYCRGENGRVHTQDVVKEFMSIMRNAGTGAKNS